MARQMMIPFLILVVVAGLLSTVSLASQISSADVAAIINQATNGGTTTDASLNDALDQLAEGPIGGSEADIEAALHQYETQNLPDPTIPPSLPTQSLGDNTIGNDGESADAAPVGSAVPAGAFPPQKAVASNGASDSATVASGPSTEKHASSTSAITVNYVSTVAIIACFFTI